MTLNEALDFAENGGSIEPTDEEVERVLAAEVRRLSQPESDEAWMARVYPQHGYCPDDGMTYAQFCRISRGRWEAEHTDLQQQLVALRQVLRNIIAIARTNGASMDDVLRNALAFATTEAD